MDADTRQVLLWMRDELVSIDAKQAVRHTEILGQLDKMAKEAQQDRDQQGVRIAELERRTRELERFKRENSGQ